MVLKIKLNEPFPNVDSIEVYRYAKHGMPYMHYPLKINGVSVHLREVGNAFVLTGYLSSLIKPELLNLIIKLIKIHPDIGGLRLNAK